jgi:hypothetical protein
LENNVLQQYIPHNYYFWDDFHSFFSAFFFKPFLRNKIDPMPLTSNNISSKVSVQLFFAVTTYNQSTLKTMKCCKSFVKITYVIHRRSFLCSFNYSKEKIVRWKHESVIRELCKCSLLADLLYRSTHSSVDYCQLHLTPFWWQIFNTIKKTATWLGNTLFYGSRISTNKKVPYNLSMEKKNHYKIAKVSRFFLLIDCILFKVLLQRKIALHKILCLLFGLWLRLTHC